jgi:hypothetical protein
MEVCRAQFALSSDLSKGISGNFLGPLNVFRYRMLGFLCPLVTKKPGLIIPRFIRQYCRITSNFLGFPAGLPLHESLHFKGQTK